MGKKGEGVSQRTCIRDPWRRIRGGGLNVEVGVGRAGESNEGKVGTTVTEQ